MSVKNLDETIKIEKSQLRLYILIGTSLPVVLVTIILSYFYLNNLETIHTNDLNELKKTVLEERKVFIQDIIERTINDIEQIRETVTQENQKKSLSQEASDKIVIEKMTNYVRKLRPSKDNYIWINHIVNYDGDDNYAIRLVHANQPQTEGKYLSTNTQDIKGNKPYAMELEGVKKEGELYFDYYFKKMDSDKIAHKLAFAKLYKPFNWVIATGIYLDDLDEFIEMKKRTMQEEYEKQKNITIIAALVLILFLINIVAYVQYNIKKLILAYEGKIDTYTTKLNLMATTDQLTGLCNRLELDNIYVKELEKAKRYESKFSIIIMDLDYFKSVNDTFGHQVGDNVLKDFSHILQSSVRSIDTVGRWGGEEFLIICPATNLDGASKLAENLRSAIEAHAFEVAGYKTSSFGVSTYRKNDTQASMIERADQALYRAKEDGRNCVRTEEK